jgi:hypothetical protein
MKETEICSKFLDDVGIRCQQFEELRYHIVPCDYLSYDTNNWHLVELKSNKGDLLKAISQLLIYHDKLKYSKYNKNPPDGERIKKVDSPKPMVLNGRELTQAEYGVFRTYKQEIYFGKRNIKLYILYDKCYQIKEFNELHSIYKKYIENTNCPEINFYYLDEDSKPIKL